MKIDENRWFNDDGDEIIIIEVEEWGEVEEDGEEMDFSPEEIQYLISLSEGIIE